MDALVQDSVSLLPGQMIRFNGDSPSYGEVISIRNLPTGHENGGAGSQVRIQLLHGTPTMAPQSITLLTDAQMAQEVQHMQEPFENPLRLGVHFTGEFQRLGALTVIRGDDFVLKYDALMMLISAIEPYQQLLVIDPLGVFSVGDPVRYLRAGEDIRLSLQQVGSKRFLSAFGETFPEHLRELALRVLADRWPMDSSVFIGFNRLLDLVSATDMPLKNLILQGLNVASDAQVFADTAEHVLNISMIADAPISVMDLSSLSEPWKHLFYEEICRELYRNAGGSVVPLLLYPENYLSNLDSWIQKADEAEINLILVASPYLPDSLSSIANNLIAVESRECVRISGELTLGLPVSLPLPEGEWPSSAVSVVSPPVFSQESAPASEQQVVTLDSVNVEKGHPAFLPLPESSMVLPESAVAPPSGVRGSALTGPVPADMPFMSEPVEPDLQPLSQDELMALMGNLPASPEFETAEEFGYEAVESPPAFKAASTPEPIQPMPSPEVVAPSIPPTASQVEPVAMSEPSLPEWGAVQEANRYPAQDVEEFAEEFSKPPAFESDEFDFDVNLDQKLDTNWESEWESPSGGVGANETGLTGSAAAASLAQDFLTELLPSGAMDLEEGDAVNLQQGAPVSSPEAAPRVASMSASLPIDEDEMVTIIQKPLEVEPMSKAGFKPGDRVRHETYGVGIINKVVPMDQDTILNITFESVGKRLLDPSRCNLTKEFS
jgi:hypothetical protein